MSKKCFILDSKTHLWPWATIIAAVPRGIEAKNIANNFVLQMPWNTGDVNQQAAFLRETSKLWNMAITAEPFEFMTIEDVLNELAFLRNENEKLNR